LSVLLYMGWSLGASFFICRRWPCELERSIACTVLVNWLELVHCLSLWCKASNLIRIGTISNVATSILNYNSFLMSLASSTTIVLIIHLGCQQMILFVLESACRRWHLFYYDVAVNWWCLSRPAILRLLIVNNYLGSSIMISIGSCILEILLCLVQLVTTAHSCCSVHEWDISWATILAVWGERRCKQWRVFGRLSFLDGTLPVVSSIWINFSIICRSWSSRADLLIVLVVKLLLSSLGSFSFERWFTASFGMMIA